jgi:serine/threonine protein kinase
MGRLPPLELLTIGVQVAEGLAYAHRRGIVHRDLKPGNIMLTESGAKLLDFGLAKWVTQLADPASNIPVVVGNETQTNQSMIVGTIAYMSPEQAKGKSMDARSDIFSFGAVLYEMTTGQRAFQGETRASTLGAVLRDDPKSITEVDPGIPPELEQIIVRCLRKDPALRFQSAADLASVAMDFGSPCKPSPEWARGLTCSAFCQIDGVPHFLAAMNPVWRAFRVP